MEREREREGDRGGGHIALHDPALETMQHHLRCSPFWSRKAQSSAQVHGEGSRLYILEGK